MESSSTDSEYASFPLVDYTLYGKELKVRCRTPNFSLIGLKPRTHTCKASAPSQKQNTDEHESYVSFMLWIFCTELFNVLLRESN